MNYSHSKSGSIMPLRCGVTLIELLIVFAIIALLVSLGTGAVQNARESARRTQCMNQQRQLALGIQMHASKHGYLPSNGGNDGTSTVRSASGNQVRIGTYTLAADRQFWWGVGLPGAAPPEQTGSWAYAILPSLEQVEAYQSVQVESAGPLFRCPSRTRANPMVPRDDSYGRYSAGDRAWAKTDYAGNRLVMLNFPDAQRLSAIADGLSNTLGTGEKAFDPIIQTETSWYYDEPIFSGGSNGTVRSGLLIERDGPGARYQDNWGSAHPGGALFSRLDGSTVFLTSNVDGELFRSLIDPKDGAH